MRRAGIISLLLITILFVSDLVFCETLILKSGKKYDCKILEKTEKYVKIDFYGVPIMYNMQEVERIEETQEKQPATSIVSDLAAKYKEGAISDRSDVNKCIEEAKEFAKKYRLDKTIESLKKAVSLEPRNSKIYVLLGSIYLQAGQIDNAIESLNTSVEIKPDNYEAHATLGTAYGLVGKTQEGINCYLKFIEYCPDQSLKAQTYVMLAEFYKKNGEDEKANGALDQALKIFGEQKDEKSVKLVQGMKDKYAEERKTLLSQTKAIETNPKNAYSYVSRGFAYYSQGKIEPAISDYNKAIEIDPRYEEAYYYRGIAEEAQDKIDLAIADYTKAIELNPKSKKSSYGRRGIVYGKKGDFDKALADLGEAIKINPDDDDAYYNRGFAYSLMGKFDLAIKDYDETIRINRERLDAVQNRAMSNFYLKNYDKTWEDVHRLESKGIFLDANFMETLKTLSGRDK